MAKTKKKAKRPNRTVRPRKGRKAKKGGKPTKAEALEEGHASAQCLLRDVNMVLQDAIGDPSAPLSRLRMLGDLGGVLVWQSRQGDVESVERAADLLSDMFLDDDREFRFGVLRGCNSAHRFVLDLYDRVTGVLGISLPNVLGHTPAFAGVRPDGRSVGQIKLRRQRADEIRRTLDAVPLKTLTTSDRSSSKTQEADAILEELRIAHEAYVNSNRDAILERLRRIAGTSGAWPEEITLLRQATEKEYRRALKSIKSRGPGKTAGSTRSKEASRSAAEETRRRTRATRQKRADRSKVLDGGMPSDPEDSWQWPGLPVSMRDLAILLIRAVKSPNRKMAAADIKESLGQYPSVVRGWHRKNSRWARWFKLFVTDEKSLWCWRGSID